MYWILFVNFCGRFFSCIFTSNVLAKKKKKVKTWTYRKDKCERHVLCKIYMNFWYEEFKNDRNGLTQWKIGLLIALVVNRMKENLGQLDEGEGGQRKMKERPGLDK